MSSQLLPALPGLPDSLGHTRPICASIPGFFLTRGDVAGAGEALLALTTLADAGLIPATVSLNALPASNPLPDLEANLWFIRAAHQFKTAGGDPALYSQRLLPLVKRIIQAIISGGSGAPLSFPGARMDDGGLLLVDNAADRATRINALWYSAIESVSQTLRAAGDHSGDHYERLAGRFRRSFAKAFWCDEHGIICTPEVRKIEGHSSSLPDVEELLFVILPASPIPKTKQRIVLTALRDRTLGTLGLKLVDGSESVLHRAWLADAVAAAAEYRGPALAEGRALAEPLRAELAAQRQWSASYRDGKPQGPADTFATAEVTGILRRLQAS